MHIIHTFISTLGFIGFSRFASGTVASFATAIFSYFILRYFNISAAIFFLILSITFGSYSTHKYVMHTNGIDPKEVVIDEFAGQILSIIISYFFCKSSNQKDLIILISLNFFLFRLFDITKIFPIYYFDRIENTFGIMSDDIVAGLMSATCFIIIHYLLMG